MPAPVFTTTPTSDDRRLLTTPPQFPRPTGLARGASPAVEAAHRDGADALWSRAVHGGTPLIEADPDDAAGGTRLFTWVHRGHARRVALVAGKLTDASTLEDALFDRIHGTDVWALTLRLPADWRSTYALAVDDGTPADVPPHLAERRVRALAAAAPERRDRIVSWYELLAVTRRDPHAREEFRGASVAAGPAAPHVPAPPAPLHRGTFSERTVAGAGGGTRTATWYVPPSAAPGPGGAGLIVMLDGDRRLAGGGAAFDAWAQAHLAPGTVALLLGHGDMAARDLDLTCNPGLIADLRTLIDAAPVALSPEASRRAIQGSSLGGLFALYAQCTAPDLFGVSICQSPSFWWPNALSGYAPEWLTTEVERSDIRLGRVHVSVGRDEWVLTGPVRRMRDALSGRCELLDYEEFSGGHEAACWEAALPGALDRLGVGPS